MNNPPKVGDRIVVYGYVDIPVTVESVERDKGTYIIHLNWGTFGKSRVYSHDEGDVWYRHSQLN